MVRLIFLLLFSTQLIASVDVGFDWYCYPFQTTDGIPTNCRPRCSKKLHVNQFFSSASGSMQATQMILFHNLLHVLYGRQPVFHADIKNPLNKSGLENLFAQVKEKACKRPAGYRMRQISDLANIDLHNSEQQFKLFILLKGGKGELIPGCTGSFLSLEDFLSLRKRGNCLDVYSASKPLLLALFGDDAVVNEVMLYQERLKKMIVIDTKLAEEKFRSAFEKHIPPEINPKLISFRVPPLEITKGLQPNRGLLGREYWNEESYHCCSLHVDDATDLDVKIISEDLSISPELLVNIPAKGPRCDDCGAPSIYLGYVDRDSRKYIDQLERQLVYTKNHPECTCYWPELSEEAAKISEDAYRLYKNLVASTPMSSLFSKSQRQKSFLKVDRGDLNAHGVTVALIADQFRFSDFYELHEELCRYALEKFGAKQVGRYYEVKKDLDEILNHLYKDFLNLYTNCLAKHPNPEIEQEILFMKLLAGDESAVDHPVEQSFIQSQKPSILNRKDGGQTSIAKQVGPFSFQARVLLERGTVLNDLLQYDESITTLSEAIRLNPLNRNGYIERAYAYLETGQMALALEDYKKIKALNIIPPYRFPVQRKGFWYSEDEQEFLSGLVEGITTGADESIKDFAPSLLDCCTGIGHGLWAFVSNPVDVTREFTLAAYALGEYCYQNCDDEWIRSSAKQLKDLAASWEDLPSRDQGRDLGYIIGKYGVDFFAPLGAMKSIQCFRDIKRANTVLTLQRCAAAQANEVKILEKTAKVAIARKQLIEAAKSGRIIARSINARHHIMQPHHAWERLISLTGNEEKDFKTLIKLLEESGIFSDIYIFKEETRNSTIIRRYTKIIDGTEIELLFSKNHNSEAFFLNDGWVVTK